VVRGRQDGSYPRRVPGDEQMPRVGAGLHSIRERRGAALERGAEIGEYRGVIRDPRRVFQRLLSERPNPERCVEEYYLQRHPVREYR
jgi:hypothetical protein